MAGIESGRLALSLEPVSVSLVVQEVLTTLSPLADRAGLEISATLALHEQAAALADRTRLAQILLNYGSNAIKYGRSGGRVIFTAYASGDRVRVTVSDTGIGIPEDKQSLLFQPFQRAGQETGTIEGTGIGLAICKRLAEAMRGGVGFRSVAGQGSEFWVELPLSAQPAAQPRSNGHRVRARRVKEPTSSRARRCCI
ncbi:MAG: hypothetical protein HC863_01815 [Myxococcales bacterium]|nr:hypothetical protein [Myxococcales bacterium]